MNDDKTILLSGRQIEAWIVRIAESMIQWSDAIGFDGPMLVGAGLEGLEDVELLPGRGGILRPARTFFHLPPQLVVPGEPVASALRALLDEMWVAFGKGDGSPSFGGGEWSGYGGQGDYRIE